MTTTSSLSRPSLFADGRRLLRMTLRLDAAVSMANGLVYLALAEPVHRLLGLPVAAAVSLGAFLLLYAAALVIVAAPTTPNRAAAMAIVELNAAWAVLSIVVAVAGWLSLNAVGSTWAVVQAAAVAGFGYVQYVGVRRMRRELPVTETSAASRRPSR